MKKTQKERVIGKLNKDGFITRNECLRNYISRLSAIIQDLEVDGWEFEAGDTYKDYKYKVIKSPFREIIYKVADGREIKVYEQ